MKTSRKRIDTFFEYIDLFVSLFMILLLVLILIYSVIYWVDNFPRALPPDAQYFYAGVGIAIVTVLGEWISGRLKAINRNYENLKLTRRINARRKE